MDVSNITVGFIGAGVMGGALAQAVSESRCRLLISDADPAKAEILAKKTGAEAGTNREIAAECRYIFLAVKPQVIGFVLDEIRDVLKARRDRYTIVSMAAGISIGEITDRASDAVPVIRIMPNTPAKIREGVILYCTENVSDEDTEGFSALLESAGTLDRIPEKLIDAGSAVSGCGPAFVYMFIEALADGAVSCGLPRDKALLYAAQTVKGAASMVTETSEHPEKLKDEVCSPGGTTIEGVRALENGRFRASVMNAVISAYEKTLTLGKKK